MLGCYQFKDMNVLQHGQSVHEWYAELHNHLTTGTPLQKEWRLPEWIYHPEIPKGLYDFEILRLYQIYHDCGKPLCRTEDEEGRQHFPNHAEHSYRRWLECSDGSDAALLIAQLIRKDMDAHTVKGAEIDEFIASSDAPSLLLTALCEIHSNAQMFGGIESTSFKIKWKQINKIGKKLYA